MKAYVLDSEFRRVPMGAAGELYLAGYQISDGYLNRPEETDKAFLDNPFDDDEEYGVLYRTGDLVRLLSDKSLGIIGRHDNQVKIRGNRVELTEVESVIRKIDGVVDVSVQTLNNGGNNELVSYIVSTLVVVKSVTTGVALFEYPYHDIVSVAVEDATILKTLSVVFLPNTPPTISL